MRHSEGMKQKKPTKRTAHDFSYVPGMFEGFIPGDPKYKALVDWANTIVKAQQIVAANAATEKVTATADAIVRAAMIARGEIVELPAGRAARAILAAGRKRRGEIEGD